MAENKDDSVKKNPSGPTQDQSTQPAKAAKKAAKPEKRLIRPKAQTQMILKS